jgi:hypothetical protein
MTKETTMALNADYRNIKDFPALYVQKNGEKVLGTVWETLVLYSLLVGLNTITDKNIDEWFFRLKALEILHGPAFRTGDGKAFDFGLSDVQRMIGLRTNVTSISRAAFLNNCKQVLADQAREASRKERSS